MLHRLIFIITLTLALISSANGARLEFNPLLVKAANEGNHLAMHAIATRSLQYGISRADSISAIEWFTKLYDEGMIEVAPLIAQTGADLGIDELFFRYSKGGDLAYCHLHGIGTEPNPNKALKIFESDPTSLLSIAGSVKVGIYPDHVRYIEDYLLSKILVEYRKKVVDQQLISDLKIKSDHRDISAMWKYAVVKGIKSKDGITSLIKAIKLKSDTACMVLLNRYLTTPISTEELDQFYRSMTYPSLKQNEDVSDLYPELTRDMTKHIYSSIARLCKNKNVLAHILSLGYEYSIYYKQTKFDKCHEYASWWKLKEQAYDFLSELTMYKVCVFAHNSKKFRDTKSPFVYQLAMNGNANAQCKMIFYTQYFNRDKEVLDVYNGNNEEERIQWKIKAVKNGFYEYSSELGYFYEDRDVELAEFYFTNALLHNRYYYYKQDRYNVYPQSEEFQAACRLAYYYESGKTMTGINENKAFIMYLTSVYLTAKVDENGKFISDNTNIENSPIPSIYKLGEFYDYGKGCEENPRKALWWYKLALKLNSKKKKHFNDPNILSDEARDFAKERIAELEKYYTPEEDYLFNKIDR